MTELTVTQLAERLGVTTRRARDLLDSGRVAGRQLANRTWLADSDSVLRYEATTRRGKGRGLDPASAWGLLWELSGLKADWLTPSTHARVRRRIRELSPDQVVKAVSTRTTAHRYTAANTKLASTGLIATGRAAAGSLGSDLIDDHRRVCGYVREGSADDYAQQHFMVTQTNGQDVIYENTLPARFDGDLMPAAVVAADLAASTDTRERSTGLKVIEELRQTWLAAH